MMFTREELTPLGEAEPPSEQRTVVSAQAEIAGKALELRMRLGMTQSGMAREMGVGARTVARYESGERWGLQALARLTAVAVNHQELDMAHYFRQAMHTLLRRR